MERHFAVVKDGIVSNVIVVDPATLVAVDPADVDTVVHFDGELLPEGSPVGIGWIYDGKTFSPPPAPPPTPEEIAAAEQKSELQADVVLNYLATHTPAECAAYVKANATSLATAVNVLSKMSMILSILAKERLS